MSSRNLLRIFSRLPFCTQKRAISSTACVYGAKASWRAAFHGELNNRNRRLKESGKAPPSIRSQFIEWNYDSELYAFGKRLQEEFDDSLLREALTDSSYVEREIKGQVDLGVETPALSLKDNLELSATGRSIIEDYSPKFLRAALPLLPEEGVRKIVEYLASEEVMCEVGLGIGLKDLILTEEYPPSSATVAKAFQAVVAALNVSSGIDRCHRFVKDFVTTQLVGKDIYDIWQITEPLDVLTDILKRSGQAEPEPRLVFQSGKNTLEAVYQVALYSDKQFIGTGYGENIPVAVEQAAYDVLKRLFHIATSSNPLPFGKEGDKLKLNDQENLSLEDWSIEKAKTIVHC